jgi:hypothetical protein
MEISVPASVKNAAKKGLEKHNNGWDGGTNTGFARARQLINNSKIPIDDVRVMRNWYARHYKTSYPFYKQWEDEGKPEKKRQNSIVAWEIWGGNAGLNFVNKHTDLLNRVYKTDYKKI